MDQWYVARGKVKEGPYSRAQLQALAGKGELRAADMLLQPGTQRWIAAGQVLGLLPATSAVRPPLIPVERGAVVASSASAATRPAAAPPPLPVSSTCAAYGPWSRPRLWIGAGSIGLCSLVTVSVLFVWGFSDRSKKGEPAAPSGGEATPGDAARHDPNKDEALAPGAPVAFSSDLDEIVYLLSQSVFVWDGVGGQDKLIARPTEAQWAKAMERLRSSRDPAVAAAAAANTPTAVRRAALRDIQQKLDADIKAIDVKLLADNKGLPTIFDDLFDPLPSEAAIDEARRKDKITSSEADRLKAELGPRNRPRRTLPRRLPRSPSFAIRRMSNSTPFAPGWMCSTRMLSPTSCSPRCVPALAPRSPRRR